MHTLPNPNTLYVSWFHGENAKGTLDLTPKYQRNPIWSDGQKCFLIDSIISGCPIPQVYLNVITSGQGRLKITFYEVVDGQQRMRAILDFIDDKFKLLKTTASSYPVSEEYKTYIGRTYSELPPSLQERIWNYPVPVQELRGWKPPEIQALFRRLNYVVERLNSQELRHSQYFGPFATTVEKLAKNEYWEDVGIFTRRDFQRMKDMEFVAELFIVTIDGVQGGTKTSIDSYYAKYDVVFNQKSKYVRMFKHTVRSLMTINNVITETRFSKKADYYGLFAAVSRFVQKHSCPVNLSEATTALQELSKRLEKNPSRYSKEETKYHDTVVEGPNKITKRNTRVDYLHELLVKHI